MSQSWLFLSTSMTTTPAQVKSSSWWIECYLLVSSLLLPFLPVQHYETRKTYADLYSADNYAFKTKVIHFTPMLRTSKVPPVIWEYNLKCLEWHALIPVNSLIPSPIIIPLPETSQHCGLATLPQHVQCAQTLETLHLTLSLTLFP